VGRLSGGGCYRIENETSDGARGVRLSLMSTRSAGDMHLCTPARVLIAGGGFAQGVCALAEIDNGSVGLIVCRRGRPKSEIVRPAGMTADISAGPGV
jgi:hypothetical protein